MNDHGECQVVDDKKKKKKQQEEEEGEDPEQPQDQRHHHLVAATSQDSTKSGSSRPLPLASCSDQVAAGASAASVASSSRTMNTTEAAQGSGARLAQGRRHWWGDCAPHVVLLREALLSSAPDIAVLGPLHGCFAFYMTHLHNEVLSSTYARTMTFGANVSRLESAFMWVGGWRPTSALVLVYSLMGLDIENALETVRAGRSIGESSTASLLSTRQLAIMHTLQKHTQHAEMKISKKLTVLQMLIGDQDMLEAVLLDAASPVANDSSRFHQVAEKRMYRFRRLLIQAEELRLHTLKDLLSLLTPIQAARCGVAVFEICASLRTTGRIMPPRLPTLAMSPFPLVAIPPLLPTPPSGLVFRRPLAVVRSGEPVVSDLSSSENNLNSDATLRDSSRPLVSDLSGDSTLNSSDEESLQSEEPHPVSDVSSSSEVLDASDVLPSQSDENARLVPSCSNSSSSSQPLAQTSSRGSEQEERNSQPLAQTSCRGSEQEERSRPLSAIHLPLSQLKLDDDGDHHHHHHHTAGMVPTANDQHPPGPSDSDESELISNRLLLLSPASSDVTIQNCSLDTAELGSYFEMPPQLPETTDDMGSTIHHAQAGSSESGDIGGSHHMQPCTNPMSVLCECAQQGPQSKEGREVKLSTRD